jgi:hypothetical protein
VEYLDEGWWHVADASGGWEPPMDVLAEPVATGTEPEVSPVEDRQTSAIQGVAGTDLPRVFPLWALAVVVGALLGAVVALVLRWRRTSQRVVVSDGSANLARLLRGALLRPRAYRGVGALFSRPLIPLVTGRRLSLPAAVERARSGRLFRGTADSAPVRCAVRRGETVIDVEQDEGAVVADLLGARDLDAWEGIADRMQTNKATEAAEWQLQGLGQRWKIRVAEAPPQRVSVIEGHLLGLGGRSRVAVVDTSGLLWEAASRDLEESPAWAAFVLGDGIAGALDLGPEERGRWLTALATEAVEQASEGAA